jgi:hypothetical protein
MHMKSIRARALAALWVAVSLSFARSASAEIKIANIEGWEITTSGRVNGFFSFIQGDSYPSTSILGAAGTDNKLSAGAGLETQQNDDQRKFQTLRFRSGFLGAVLGFGVKTALTKDTSMSAHIETWNTIETSRNKAAPNPTDVRQALRRVRLHGSRLNESNVVDEVRPGAGNHGKDDLELGVEMVVDRLERRRRDGKFDHRVGVAR